MSDTGTFPGNATGIDPAATATGTRLPVINPEALQAALEQVPEGREAAVRDLAARIDIADPGSILRFGQEAQNRATLAADAMLEGARNREAGEAGVTLSTLLGTLRGFDMRGLAEKPGFFARIFNKAGAETAKVVQRYETIKGQVEEVGDRLDGHRTKLLEDVEKLERLYRATLDWFHALGDHIAAGETVLSARRPGGGTRHGAGGRGRRQRGGAAAARPARGARRAGTPGARPAADPAGGDAGAALDPADPGERQGAGGQDPERHRQYRAALAQQLAQALAIQTMREAGRTLKEATDLTNQLLVGNAERLRQGNLEARTQLKRGVFDIEAVKRANAPSSPPSRTACASPRDAQAQRASATKELEKAEGEIRRALLAARASGTRPGARPVASGGAGRRHAQPGSIGTEQEMVAVARTHLVPAQATFGRWRIAGAGALAGRPPLPGRPSRDGHGFPAS